MKINNPFLITALTIGAAFLRASAQQPPAPPDSSDTQPADGPQHGGPGQHPPHPAPPLMEALDANHDRTISAEEIGKSPEALLSLDKNKDGKLTKEEMHPRPPMGGAQGNDEKRGKKRPEQKGKGPGEKRPAPPIVKALDADGDQEISAQEILNAPESLKTLDKNSDGQLSEDEFRPPHPLNKEGPGGEGEEGGEPPAPPTE